VLLIFCIDFVRTGFTDCVFGCIGLCDSTTGTDIEDFVEVIGLLAVDEFVELFAEDINDSFDVFDDCGTDLVVNDFWCSAMVWSFCFGNTIDMAAVDWTPLLLLLSLDLLLIL
jgi:hypothetical protein